MKLIIELEGEDLSDIEAKMKRLVTDMTTNAAAVPAVVTTEPSVAASPAEVKKRGPKPKDKTPEPETSAVEEAKAPDYDAVVNACKTFLGTHGMPELRKFLLTFGAEQTRALKPDQFADVIAKAASWVPAA